MSNAAIMIHPDAYDTQGRRLMGRQSAGESFLRGLLRHADVDRFHFWNATRQPAAELEQMVARIEPPPRPVRWLATRPELADPGVAFLPGAGFGKEPWLRRSVGARRYGLCGVTHTTATHRIMDSFAELVAGPVEPWDALICTSTAVRQSTEHQFELVRQDLRERLGATRFATPLVTTIPLGVHAADFAPRPEARKSWRERLGIPEDALAAFSMGRLSASSKMNPAPAALALEQAAQRTGARLCWIVAGWSETEAMAERLHALTRALCPSVTYIPVDGRPPDVRFSIWSAGDIFISLSDNIQETFGLTPVEAMAAGLPVVVSDWNGYRDTVRHGVDGFRIPTSAPRPGLGRDVAFQYAAERLTYDAYIAVTTQVTAVDPALTVSALTRLILDPQLRRRMGEAGRKRAAEVFDWSVVIPQYQALWAEQTARRLAAIEAGGPVLGPADDPARPDPFTLFAGYPTRTLRPDHRLAIAPGLSWSGARARLSHDLAAMMSGFLPTLEEAEQVFEALSRVGHASVRDIVAPFGPRASVVERGLTWMLKFEVLSLLGQQELPRQADTAD
ncbi:glycosyltransferase family 4 protein [Phenylobacterium terrae]|uniref:Glycosyltransferase family 4 protein n=1 Tax=Phenylobacterium terrae TaxID=2665495 RepID=A0ABW4MYD1_9CAUL